MNLSVDAGPRSDKYFLTSEHHYHMLPRKMLLARAIRLYFSTRLIASRYSTICTFDYSLPPYLP